MVTRNKTRLEEAVPTCSLRFFKWLTPKVKGFPDSHFIGSPRAVLGFSTEFSASLVEMKVPAGNNQDLRRRVIAPNGGSFGAAPGDPRWDDGTMGRLKSGNIWKSFGFGGLMMIYDDLWWFMMIYDDLWWFMMIYDDLWWFMMIYDDLWWFMMTYDDLWWFMMTYDDLVFHFDPKFHWSLIWDIGEFHWGLNLKVTP